MTPRKFVGLNQLTFRTVRFTKSSDNGRSPTGFAEGALHYQLSGMRKSLIVMAFSVIMGSVKDHSAAALAISVRTAATSRMADIT
jgi:hypothetical protein